MNVLNSNHKSWRQSVRLGIETMWAYRRRALYVASVVALTSALQILMRSPTYEAEAKVLIETGREIAVRADLGAPASHLSRDTERMIRNELQILRSRELAKRFLLEFEVGRLYPELKSEVAELNLEKAIKRFLQNLRVRAHEGTDTVAIAFTHGDPLVAPAALESFIEVFRQRHLEIYSDSELRVFLEEQVLAAKESLDGVEGELRALRADKHSYFSEDAQDLVGRQRHELDERVKQANMRVAALEQKVRALAEQKKNVQKQVHLFSEEDPTIADARSELLTLRLEEKDLLGTYKEENRQIKKNPREDRRHRDLSR